MSRGNIIETCRSEHSSQFVVVKKKYDNKRMYRLEKSKQDNSKTQVPISRDLKQQM